MATKYLTDEKEPEYILELQNKLIENSDIFKTIIKVLPYPLLILNDKRQTVFYNQALLDLLEVNQQTHLFGFRPGDIFQCENAYKEDGCGTTEFCRTCGAAKAIEASLAKRKDIQECRITTIEDEALDFRVWTYPFQINNQKFILFTLIDISHEKRREILERIFYHDILNTANGIKGILENCDTDNLENIREFNYLARNFVKILIDEIQSQRIFSLAESGSLEIQLEKFKLNALIDEVLTLFSLQTQFKDIVIERSVPEDLILVTDKTILRRIITNLTKNALEASKSGSKVFISANQDDDKVEIKFLNDSVMPEIVQLQIFKRSFSTKGKGRGLGTYSARLLTERYLKGEISFKSMEGFGTEFKILIPLKLSSSF